MAVTLGARPVAVPSPTGNALNRRHLLLLILMTAAIVGMAYYTLENGFFMHGD